MKHLPLKVQEEYIIVSNGACLLHIGQDKVEVQHFLSKKMIEEAISFSCSYIDDETQLLGISLDKLYLIDALTAGPAALREVNFLQTAITYVTSEELLASDTMLNTMLLTGPVSRIEEAYEASLELHSAGLSYVHSLPWMIEFLSPGVHKASALKELCSFLDISMDEVLAIGDQANDLEMLEEAGIGVAMGNAPIFMQEMADLVTKTNEADGVAYIIDQLLDNRLDLKV